MAANSLTVRRLPQRLARDASLTIARFFWPGSPQRGRAVIERVMGLDDDRVRFLVDKCVRDFGARHHDLLEIFEDHFEEAISRTEIECESNRDRRHLIGAYFTMEYAYASAAFFNPSIVPAFDQDDLPPGSTRFLISLRAVGEGHISSIVFRRGVLDENCGITFDPVPSWSRRMSVVEDRCFTKSGFLQKLIETGAYTDLAGVVLAGVGDSFSISEMQQAIEKTRMILDDPAKVAGTADTMLWLAHSNYKVRIPDDADMSQLVIYPLSENESNGIEDMRLVRFTDDDGSVHYYGTYTAYNGSAILPQLMEIRGDRTVEVHTLGGRYAVNKGLALFPRRIDGWYAMITRHDGENLYFATSDNVRFWNEATLIQQPRVPWEFVQIGNCGSPLETEAGWLLLTHGVGAMRRYAIGAMLLDKADPTKIIGQLSEPLLLPQPEERGGYVPNVVYTCGAMIHNGTLVIPYGVSDVETAFATVGVKDLLRVLES